MTNAYDLQWLVIYSDIIWANICTAHKKTNTRKWFSVSTAILHCVTFKWCSALLFTLHSERKHSWQTAADDLLGFLGKSSTVETVSRRYRWRPCPSRRRANFSNAGCAVVVSAADVWVDIASEIRRRGTTRSQLSILPAYRHMLPPTTVDQPRWAGRLLPFTLPQKLSTFQPWKSTVVGIV